MPPPELSARTTSNSLASLSTIIVGEEETDRGRLPAPRPRTPAIQQLFRMSSRTPSPPFSRPTRRRRSSNASPSSPVRATSAPPPAAALGDQLRLQLRDLARLRLEQQHRRRRGIHDQPGPDSEELRRRHEQHALHRRGEGADGLLLRHRQPDLVGRSGPDRPRPGRRLREAPPRSRWGTSNGRTRRSTTPASPPSRPTRRSPTRTAARPRHRHHQRREKTGATGITYAVVTARSYHSGIVKDLFMDGSVHSVGNSIDPAVWQALGTRAGGETVNFQE